jgi:hypothetical protein
MVTFLFVIAISAFIPYVAVPTIQHGIESAVQTSVPNEGGNGTRAASISAVTPAAGAGAPESSEPAVRPQPE